MKDIKYAITKIKKHASLNKKISCIFLGNTAQKEKDSYYITPIRENKIKINYPRDSFDKDGLFTFPKKQKIIKLNYKMDYLQSLKKSVNFFISCVKNKKKFSRKSFILAKSTLEFFL